MSVRLFISWVGNLLPIDISTEADSKTVSGPDVGQTLCYWPVAQDSGAPLAKDYRRNGGRCACDVMKTMEGQLWICLVNFRAERDEARHQGVSSREEKGHESTPPALQTGCHVPSSGAAGFPLTPTLSHQGRGGEFGVAGARRKFETEPLSEKGHESTPSFGRPRLPVQNAQQHHAVLPPAAIMDLLPVICFQTQPNVCTLGTSKIETVTQPVVATDV